MSLSHKNPALTLVVLMCGLVIAMLPIAVGILFPLGLLLPQLALPGSDIFLGYVGPHSLPRAMAIITPCIALIGFSSLLLLRGKLAVERYVANSI